jgi:alkylation response protein AidB-like acyl-CoA dehydrogenase
MNFDFRETDKSLQKKIIHALAPAEEDLKGLQERPDQEIRQAVLRWTKALADIGYLEIGVDEGRNSAALVAARETLAGLFPAFFLTVEVSARLLGRLVAAHGSDRQRAEVLDGVRNGTLIGAVALTEETGSLDHNPLTTFGASAAEGFLVDGRKGHVPNAPIADCIAVAGRIYDQTAFFLVTPGMEGLSVGDRLLTLGFRDVCAAPITLSQCTVRREHVVGPIPDRDPIRDLRRWEDEIITAASLGLMQRSFTAARDYAKTHMSGGKPIIAYQEISFMLAEMLTLLQTAQLLAYRAGWMSESEQREAEVVAQCARVFCAEAAEEVASHGVQALGGKGLLNGNPAEQSYRDAKYLQVTGTSTEISRMKIADGILGD